MTQDVGAPFGTGSREPSPAVSALPGFDPSRCQWCGDDGFDLKGLAHHVWMRCEVVERLAQENADDVAAGHWANWEDAQRRNAIAMEAGTAETPSGSVHDSAAIAQRNPA